MRVLVVDDSRTMRSIIRRALEGLNQPEIEIIEAADGAEALEIARNDRLELDVVLLDWSMPRLDGIGFLKAVKGMAPMKDTAVIMVTSQAQRAHVAEALRWGARDYVVKPFDEGTLREKFARLQAQIEARKCAETSLMLQAIARSAAADEKAPFLADLTQELIDEMKLRGRHRAWEAGVIIAYPHHVLDTLDIVLSGELEVENAEGTLEILDAGHCFGEESFVSGRPLGVTIRARVRCDILQLSRLALGELARRFPKLSYALSSLVARRSTARRAQDPAVGFTGKLNAMPIADLVQVLHLCHKTGELRLEGSGREASIFVEDGAVADARAGGAEGEEAVYEILGWRDAAFSFRSGVRSGRRTIGQPTMTLLMEGARRLDEGRRAGGAGSDAGTAAGI
ncbi:MAG: response regulator [Planctomycetes bacterium]|nr:response regulator [Planctomycetota bacterium]